MKIKKIGRLLIGICCLVAFGQARAQNEVTPEQIKKLISRMKTELEKNDDTFPLLIAETAQKAAASTDPASAAVLQSMLAEMYANYYNRNRWNIDRRTPVVGYVPADIQVWTTNIFVDTVQAYVDRSLADAPLLQKTPVSAFRALLEPGKDSPALRPTLFDFLSYRGVSILQQMNSRNNNTTLENDIERIYRNLVDFRRKAGNPEALMLAELDELRYRYRQPYEKADRTRYMAALDSLQQRYASDNFSVEIAIARLQLLEMSTTYSQRSDSLDAAIYDLIRETAARYPNYPRTAVLKNKLKEITQPSFSAETDRMVYPDGKISIRLSTRNLPSITVTLRRSNESPVAYYYQYNDRRLKKNPGQVVGRITAQLPAAAPYRNQDTVLTLPAPDYGLYVCEITAGPNVPATRNIVSVSRLFSAAQKLGENSGNILVTDYKSGKPVEGAQVILYTSDSLKQVKTVTTGPDGLARITATGKKGNAYRVVKGPDSFSTATPLYWGGTDYRPHYDTEVALFCDRAIYRPGQTVFFKGIAYTGDPDKPQVTPGQRYTVSLRDANRQELAKKDFTTDAFGSFNGSFALPEGTLDGYFSISTKNGDISFRVEEYKRPTFAVDFLPIRTEVQFGDNVTLHGTARTFSGADLDGATVAYRIVRRPQWTRGYYFDPETQVAAGKTTVGADGTFAFSFKPEKNTDLPAGTDNYYRYEVIASVTSSIGETQEGNYFFSVGDRSLLLSTSLTARLDKDGKEPIVVSARNLNGQPVTAQGTYTLSLLKDRGEWNDNLRPEKPEVEKDVRSGSFTAGTPLNITGLSQLPSGPYRLTMHAVDSQGRPVTDTEDFILYGTHDKRPPVRTHSWVVPLKTSVWPGETAEVIFGTSVPRAYILYQIVAGGRVLDQQRLELADANRTFRIPYTEQFGNGVILSLTYVEDGKMYNEQIPIVRKFPDRRLTVRPQTFRDRLRPGQSETWSFRVTDADSLPAAADFLAGMYDAALDELAPNNWYFNPIRLFQPNFYPFNANPALGSMYANSSARLSLVKVPVFQYDRIDWQGVFTYGAADLYGGMLPVIAMAAGTRSMKQAAANAGFYVRGVAQEEMALDVAEDSAPVLAESEVMNSNPEPPATPALDAAGREPVQLRRNFNETAFFYPNLRTDEQGNVSLSFTLPESNTTWKFLSLAYTKDLKHGGFTGTTISQKELMVLPNLPRFLRRGDRVTLATQIINLSDKNLSGNVRLELFDPATEKALPGLEQPVRPFSVAAGETGNASWLIDVPAGTDLIGCRIVAETPEASDGEQHLIPVLPDEILVTESVPFVLPRAGEKTIATGWKATGSSTLPYLMTLELTANPVWYAVQALPTVNVPETDNVVSIFSAYYTNILAESIARSHPRIRTLIEQWKKQGGTSETLYSNLQKNQELKNILLQETPWVLAARNETEQKQQLALLFDLNRANDLKRQALQKLAELQTSAGGWSWYPGMPDSRTITLYVLKGMAQLTRLGAIEYGEQEKTMQIQALRYLDQQIVSDYKIGKNASGPKEFLPAETIEFLYVRSAYRDIPEGDAREAIRYFTSLAEKSREKLSLYDRALMAQLLFRNGNKAEALKRIDALRKIATRSESLGMYWANNRQTTGFFVSPVSVHCQLLEAFGEIDPRPEEINAMKQWLLMQKQTQRWESVPATVNAIYALLSTGSDWLADNGNCVVTWGDHTFDTASGDAGTGYIQETFRGKAIEPAMETLTVRKTGDAPAWGAVYTQFFEPVNRVRASEDKALSVEKKLFVTVTGTNGPELRPVTAANPLRPGDKVTVRLIVSADRDMEYVFLKDMRAGCFEPANQLSGTEARDGLWYYQSPKDASQQFFFYRFPKGTFVVEYAVYVARAGEYAGGISTIQCLYAPEYVSHTEGTTIEVKE